MSDTTTTTTIASVPTPVSVSNLLPEWTNRRRVIFWCLWFCAWIVGTVTISTCAALFLNLFLKVSVDNNVIQLMTTLVYTAAFVSTSIIGSYVFGANFDYANSRQHLTDALTQTTVKTNPL